MKIETTVNTPLEKSVAFERIHHFLLKRGYQESVGDTKNLYRHEFISRSGSALLNNTWNCTVRFDFIETYDSREIRIVYDIASSAGVISSLDKKYWLNEILKLKQSLQNTSYQFDPVDKTIKPRLFTVKDFILLFLIMLSPLPLFIGLLVILIKFEMLPELIEQFIPFVFIGVEILVGQLIWNKWTKSSVNKIIRDGDIVLTD